MDYNFDKKSIFVPNKFFKMQVFDIIKTLSPLEIRDLRIFLRSDWFNYRADVRLLFEVLVKISQKKSPNLPEKSVLFAQIFPEKTIFDDRLLRLAGSWLTDSIDDYWRWQAISGDAVLGNQALARAYRRHNLPVLAHKKAALAREVLEKNALRNAEYFQANHDILSEEFRVNATNNRTEAMNVQALGDALDTWFFAQKLRQVCTALSHSAVFNAEYNFGFLPMILTQIERENLTELPAIGLYYYCYKALSQPENEVIFAIFRQKIVEFGALFPEEELRDLYLLAINFCTRRVNEGSKTHIREGFELYRNGLERGIFTQNGVLSRFTFRNAVALGLMLKELDWVADFLPKFRDFLEPIYRKSTHDFSLARLEYARGNFAAALVLLQHAEYEDLLATLSAKTLVVKILYETDAHDSLFSHLDSMRIFIKRHKELGYHRENYLNLIRFTQRLAALSLSDKSAARQFLADVEATKKMTEKDWLLGKVLGRG
jgi:hypothetical protein